LPEKLSNFFFPIGIGDKKLEINSQNSKNSRKKRGEKDQRTAEFIVNKNVLLGQTSGEFLETL